MSSSEASHSDYKNEELSDSDRESLSREASSSYFRTEFPNRCEQVLFEKPIEVACGNNNGSKSRVNRSTQASCILSDQEDVPKGRKKWIRPPLVGQASSCGDIAMKDLQSVIDSDEGESISLGQEKHGSGDYLTSELFPNRKDYISERPPEGGSDPSLPNATERSDDHRPSSVSSVASGRPLEWDSGADVGYVLDDKTQHLSTLERLALVRGTAGLLARSDPEGMTMSYKKGNPLPLTVGLPYAESTPVTNSSKSSKSSGLISISPIVENKGQDNSSVKPPVHLFPEVIVKNYNEATDNESRTTAKSHVDSVGLSENNVRDNILASSKKLSTSLENIQDDISIDVRAFTFPRSQSQSNLEIVKNSVKPQALNDQFGLPVSNSSSSVATVVNRDNVNKCPPFIQSSYFISNADSKQSVSKDPLGGGDANTYSSNNFKTVDHSSNVNTNSLDSDQPNGDRVNSFEYLPGHMYEDATDKYSFDHDLRDERKPNEESANEFENSSDKDTLQKDVERAIKLLTEFINGPKTNDKLLKKKLVKKIVEKLIKTKYLDDEEFSNRETPLGWEPSRKPERSSCNLGTFRDSTSVSDSRTSLQPEIRPEKSTVDKCTGTAYSTSLSGRSVSSEYCSGIESSKNSTENSCQSNGSRLHSATSGTKKPILKHTRKPTIEDSSADSKSSNWHEPTSLSEKHYENRKKKESKRYKDEKLIKYIQVEKKNQLDWIKSEINHLNNLKMLLEKHETLKSNVNSLKNARQKIQATVEQVKSTSTDNSNSVNNLKKRTYSLETKETSDKVGNHNSSSKGSRNPNSLHLSSVCSERNTSSETGWSSHHYFESDSEVEIKRQNAAAAVAAAVAEKVDNAKMRQREREELLKKGEKRRQSSRVDVATETVSSVAVQTGRFPKPVAYSINLNQLSGDEALKGVELKPQRNVPNIDDRSPRDVMVSLAELTEAIGKVLHTKSRRDITTREGREPPSSNKKTDCNMQPRNSLYPQPTTLQDYLATNRPDYLIRAEERRKILSELADMRENRQKIKKQLLAGAAAGVENPTQLPPPPLAVKRVVSQKNMRRQTVKKYRQLSEVRNKQSDMKQKEAYKTNKLMADIFTRKLQARTLKGQVDHSNSISIISSV